ARSLYAFSTENWTRPQAEVEALFGLFMEYFTNEVEELHANNVRIRMLGDKAGLPANVRASVNAAEEKTAGNSGLSLNVALNYGSRSETVRAVKKLAEAAALGELDPGKIDEDMLLSSLDTGGLPELDLLIRTGGDQRLSNFLLLQAAYAEFAFVDALWPDFSDELYMDSLRDFAQRNRRFGGLK
ncbi:MAG: di-trans,poly-cis-decaprenylcistransferase, partial [Clostridia bacterium]|nr:di-trans,poly-cis-decaprenylcistransferase [Clostridia bacterium]